MSVFNFILLSNITVAVFNKTTIEIINLFEEFWLRKLRYLPWHPNRYSLNISKSGINFDWSQCSNWCLSEDIGLIFSMNTTMEKFVALEELSTIESYLILFFTSESCCNGNEEDNKEFWRNSFFKLSTLQKNWFDLTNQFSNYPFQSFGSPYNKNNAFCRGFESWFCQKAQKNCFFFT